MPAHDDRDRVIDRLLKQSNRPAPAPLRSECVDGERIAAWAGGALPSKDAALVEQHVSTCARCQTMLATFARTESAAAAAGTSHAGFGWHLRWLVPLATAATVAAIWVAIPHETSRLETFRPETEQAQKGEQKKESPAAVPSEPAAPQAAARASAQPAAKTVPTPAAPPVPKKRLDEKRLDKDALAAGTLDRVATSRDAPSAKVAQERARSNLNEVAAAAPRVAETAGVRAESPSIVARQAAAVDIAIASPVASHRWRIVGPGRIEQTVDGGSSWTPISLSAPDVLTAGHSPARTVAWLVGRGGAVYVTADGARFERVPLTEAADLVSVVAIDERQATVTAADGRTFRTTDRGATWVR